MTTDRASIERLSLQALGRPLQTWRWATIENRMSAFLDGRMRPQFLSSLQVATV